VAAVGAGAFVAKTGDAMTGPLTLAADPTASGHAANRHYVDIGLAGKASLIAGLVPAGQLGSGVADTAKCLKGDQTWGPCDTSSNAVSIQGVPVDSTAPTDGHVPTYDAAQGMYKPKAGGGLSDGMRAVKYATDFNWSATPTDDLSTPGSKTITLGACPAGVRGSEPEYWVYLGGTGTAEAVKVAGGSCAGNGSAGTLQFTTVNAHPTGYTVGSASSGLQEASIAARITPSNPTGTPQAGRVIAPPGEFNAYARISFRSDNQTIDFSGSIVNCWMDDPCIFVGDPVTSTSNVNITLLNPRGRPTIANGTKPFIEVNAQKTRIFNVMTRIPYNGGTFGAYVQVDDDQAFLLDGLDTTTGTRGVRCDATYCGAYVTAPGPFNTWSAVGWLKHLNISAACVGNGVDWQSGNSLHISDSVIQGYAQYGVRSGTARGGYSSPTELTDVYMEVGNCSNPVAGLGIAGVIQQGARLKVDGGIGPQGSFPRFSNTGSTDYYYYLVARHATHGPSMPLYVGHALTNGSGTITVTSPDIAAATSFDLLRVTFTSTPPYTAAPYGTGNWAVATAVTRASACTGGVCTFNDPQAPLQSYTVTDPPTYFPKLDFWNGDVVLGSKSDSASPYDVAMLTMFNNDGNRNIVSELGTIQPAVVTDHCPWRQDWIPGWFSCTSGYARAWVIGAFRDASNTTNQKGKVNLLQPLGVPSHAITLGDSIPGKTIAWANNRPPNDADDAFIGYDTKTGGASTLGVSFGAPYSLSNYIGNVGDGTNWKERLTASAKTFKLPVTAPNFISNVAVGTQPYATISTTLNSNLNADMVDGAHASSTASAGVIPIADAAGKIPSTFLPASGGSEADGYTPSSGTKTITGRLHVTQDVAVDGQLNLSGPYQIESDLPPTALTAAAANKSKIGFDTDGKLKVSENAGTPAEIAKRGAIDSTDVTSGNKQGNGTKFAMASGTFTAGNLRRSDANGNEVDSGAASPPYSIPWLTVPRAGAVSGASFPSTANRAALWGVVLSFPVTTTRVAYSVGTADTNSNTYDIGIYDSAGSLKAHIGPTAASTFAGTTGPHQLNWTSSITLQPGKYYLAITSSCTASCAQLAADNGSGVTFANNIWVTVASGGSLDANISPPSDSWVFTSYIPAWGVN
jgi:hypothetical protein